MTTYSASDLATKNVNNGHRPNAVTYFGSVTTTSNAVAADVVRFCVVPAGTLVTAVTVTVTTAFGASTTPATLQFAPLDGTAATSFGATDAVILAAVSKGITYAPTPVRLTKDSYCTLLIGTPTTAATGVANVVVHGEGVGAA